MSQGGFCLWGHSTSSLAICLGECPQPGGLAGSHLNKYLIKTKDYFISSWKEQEALLFTPESEYFLFLECLCRKPCAATCLGLVWGNEGVRGSHGVVQASFLPPFCWCWGHGGLEGPWPWGWRVLSCPMSLRTHPQPKEGQKPPHPKEAREKSHSNSKGDVTHKKWMTSRMG